MENRQPSVAPGGHDNSRAGDGRNEKWHESNNSSLFDGVRGRVPRQVDKYCIIIVSVQRSIEYVRSRKAEASKAVPKSSPRASN
ncbi:hypothetical protein E2562_004277 [Oryza meyeriana var. granulata]|uniref:Uncharacterized protein n=1 Tax=Oryza meyeriana var. granulata TaxID=110450 RepID=A0A6G1BST0_9ORYZ|nr:hypothetical protein E2562_004277 [Oryza meyeriana var. granulata]